MRYPLYLALFVGFITLFAALHIVNSAEASTPLTAAVTVHEENQPVSSREMLSTEPNQDSVATPTPPDTTVSQPQTQTQTATPAPAVVANNTTPTAPVSLSIPSISLTVPVIQVGLNAKGEMDVPDGNTNNVGWYKDGTIPGNEGSAVLDAHVFAALKNLRYAKVGDSIYVKDASGTLRHFVIRSSMVYEVASVPRELLFNRTGGTYLNIITCAGTFDASINTYDHRLIVYAELVND